MARDPVLARCCSSLHPWRHPMIATYRECTPWIFERTCVVRDLLLPRNCYRSRSISPSPLLSTANVSRYLRSNVPRPNGWKIDRWDIQREIDLWDDRVSLRVFIVTQKDRLMSLGSERKDICYYQVRHVVFRSYGGLITLYRIHDRFLFPSFASLCNVSVQMILDVFTENMHKRRSVDGNVQEQALPIPVQMFLWRQLRYNILLRKSI